MLQLIIDTRERALHKYFTRYSFASVKQITHGDFNILVNGRLMATIERKTINDYAASIKDGRTANKSKLLSLRAKTGCQIYYIVEGYLGHKNPDTEFQHVKWSSIQNSMMHLRTEHYIFIERTASAEDSANFLVELCSSFMRREGFSENLGLTIGSLGTSVEPDDYDLPELQSPIAAGEAYNTEIAAGEAYNTEIAAGEAYNTEFAAPSSAIETQYNLDRSTAGNDAALLTMKVEKTRSEHIIAIWKNVPGIGMQTALELSTRSIILVLCADLNLLLTQTGRKLPKNTRDALLLLRTPNINDAQRKFVAGFPNIGMKKSIQILLHFGSLSNMINTLSTSDDALSQISGFGSITSKYMYNLIFQ